MMHESTGDDGLASLAEFGHQVVVVACPTYRAKQLLNDIRKDNRALKEVLPIGIANEDGTVTSLLGIPPLLVFAPSLGAVGQLSDTMGSRIRMILVDLEVASGGEAIVDESPKPAEPVDADEEEDAPVDLSDETSRLSQGRPTDKKPKRIGGV